MKLYIGKVIDNKDPDEEGKVKLYNKSLHQDISKDKLSWARQNREFTSDIPEIDDLIWFYFEKESIHENAFYGNKVTLKEYHDHLKYEEEVKSNVEAESNYPDVKFIYLKNGVCIALSSSEDTPEITIHHSEKSHIFIDKDGNIKVNSDDNKIILNEDGIEVTDKNDNTVILDSDGMSLTDSNGNEVAMGMMGMDIISSMGSEINMGVLGMTLNTGDAITWMPNILVVDPMTGAPHGGVGAGIMMLKGM